MDEKRLAEVREYFSQDKYAMFTGCQVDEVEDGYAKVSFEIKDMHRNAHGGVMGGAIFTVADFASAVATNQHGKVCVATNVNINYVGNTKEDGKLIAICKVIKSGRTTILSEVEVTDNNAKQIAYAMVSCFRMN